MLSVLIEPSIIREVGCITYLDVELRFILPDPTVTVASNAGALLPPWDLSCAPGLF